MPIVGQVQAVDSTGKVFTATSNAQGAYTINVAGGTPPFLLTVTGLSGGVMQTLNSIATATNQTVNITPITDLIVSAAANAPGGATLAGTCTSTSTVASCLAVLTAATSGSNLSNATSQIVAMLQQLDPGLADPINGSFTANGTGMDGLLDQILMTPATATSLQATVTLVAVPGTAVGSVTLSSSSGGTATVAPSALTTAQIAAADAGTAVLSQIQTCVADFSALYPPTTSTLPNSTQVATYVSTNFSYAGPAVAPAGPTWPAFTTAGNINTEMPITAAGLAPFDFTPQASGSPLTGSPPIALNGSGQPTYAWVRLAPGQGDNGDVPIWEFVPAATSCGWQMVGPQRVGLELHPRISQYVTNGVTTYERELAFHVDDSKATAESITSITITGHGAAANALAVYSGNTSSPVGAVTALVLIPPLDGNGWMEIQGQAGVSGSYYGGAEAIQSCQDLASTSAAAGTPCYDETAVAPGTVFIAHVASSNATYPAYSFAAQVGSVPLAMSFITANASNLFASFSSITPANIAAVNALGKTAGQTFADNTFVFTYTIPTAYGPADPDNCDVDLYDGSGKLALQAEQGLVSATSCSFVTAQLNFGSLTLSTTAGTPSSGWASIGIILLGNAVSSGESYP